MNTGNAITDQKEQTGVVVRKKLIRSQRCAVATILQRIKTLSRLLLFECYTGYLPLERCNSVDLFFSFAPVPTLQPIRDTEVRCETTHPKTMEYNKV